MIIVHSFVPDIAVRYGVHAAILLQNISFWCEKNRANGVNEYDGNWWTYNSMKAFTTLFPYMTEKQVRTALDKLISAGILLTGNYNANRYDRTMWYAVSANASAIIDNFHSPSKANESAPQGEPIPVVNTVVNTVIDIPPVTTNVVTSPKGERTPVEDEKKTTKDDNENHRPSSLAGTPKGNPSPHIPRAPSPCDERFEQFWAVYPRKVGKGAARKAFAKIKPNDELLKRMVVAVVTQSKSDAWTKDGGQFIPNPSTWLNQERWEDEINPTGKPPKGSMTDEEWRRNGW